MKKFEEKIFDAIENVDMELIEEASYKKNYFLQKNKIRVIAAAACFVFIMGVVFTIPFFNNTNNSLIPSNKITTNITSNNKTDETLNNEENSVGDQQVNSDEVNTNSSNISNNTISKDNTQGNSTGNNIGNNNNNSGSNNNGNNNNNSGDKTPPNVNLIPNEKVENVDLTGVGSPTPIKNVTKPRVYSYNDTNTRNEIFDQNPVDKDFLSSLKDFSYETTSKFLSNKKGSSNYSPVSFYYALAMATTGADGDTAKDLLSFLKVPNQEILSTQTSNLYRRLYIENEIGSLKIANSFWMNKNYTFKDSFTNNLANNFYAEAFKLNFKDKAETLKIGKWIADNTKGLITPKMQIPENSLFALINTIYFYDQWDRQFDKKLTKTDVFNTPEKKVNVDFMNSRSDDTIYQGNGFNRLELRLKNNNKMVFILPDENVTPQQLLSSKERTKEIFEGGKAKDYIVNCKIPKFNIKSSFSFIEDMKAMGLKNPFTNDANFSKISNMPSKIEIIKQQTSIKINEKGVESSTYT
ncbi:MAG: serpin family protein, partial [Clostridia bacterium]